MSNKLTTMALEILEIESDITFRFDRTKDPHVTVDDFTMYTFEQIWGSTALGFGGVGGQAMTSARTYVFIPEYVNQKCFVYFAGRFAYSVEYSQTFMDDVLAENMASIAHSWKYNKGTG